MNYLKTREVKNPARGTKGSAGIDFFVPEDVGWDTLTLHPGQAIKIPSGIKVRVPDGMALVFMNKSGVALNKGLSVGAAVIDSDYQGEVNLHVINTSSKPTVINKGEKLVQGLLLNVSHEGMIECNNEEDLYGDDNSERGQGGFGSTGTGIEVNRVPNLVKSIANEHLTHDGHL